MSVIQGAFYLLIYSSRNQTGGHKCYSIRSFNERRLKKIFKRNNLRTRSLSNKSFKKPIDHCREVLSNREMVMGVGWGGGGACRMICMHILHTVLLTW